MVKAMARRTSSLGDGVQPARKTPSERAEVARWATIARERAEVMIDTLRYASC